MSGSVHKDKDMEPFTKIGKPPTPVDFCRDSISFRGGAKSEGICLLFKIKGYLCIVVGNRPRETLQNGAVFRWSNRGR